MRIYANQLQQNLAKGLQPLYLIFGDEPLQKIEAMDAIRHTSKQQGFTERQTLTVDNSFDWHSLILAFNSLSLFSDRQLIELEIDKGKPGQQGAKVLQELLPLFNPDTILVIHGGKLEAATSKAKWFKALEAKGVFLPIYPIEGDQFSTWLRQRSQQAQISLTPQGIALLAEFFAGNLLGAAQEIEKLAICHAGQAISSEYLQSILLNQSRFTVFQLLDCLLAGQIEQALLILISLQREGVEPTIVNWALSREILQLYEMKTLIIGGMAVSQVLQQFAVWSNRQNLFTTALSRLSLAQLAAMIADLNSVDHKIKSFMPFDPYVDFCHISLSFKFADQLTHFPIAPLSNPHG